MIYLIRHGQSEANVNIKVLTQMHNAEVRLTDLGREQAQKSGELLKDRIDFHGATCIVSSPYKRCVETATIIGSIVGSKVEQNILLSEIGCGEEEGCNTEEFETRPKEKFHYDRNVMQYKPYRGESFLDVHIRMGLFTVQNDYFKHCSNTIIVSHASPCLMLHYFLTKTVPGKEIELQAFNYWPNAAIRAYKFWNQSSPCEYKGLLQKDLKDVFV